MSISKEDLEYHGVGILKWDNTAETAELFVEEFFKTPVGQQIMGQGLKTKRNMEVILSEAQDATGHEDISLKEFESVARQLFLNGDLLPKTKQAPQTPAEPQLTASQRAWQEFRIFTDSHSVQECKNRARVDEAYSKFLHTNLVREINSGVGDAVENSLERPVKTKKVSADIAQFAQDYRNMRSDQLKSLLSPASVGAQAAAHYKNLYEQAIAAGLI
jgi:hypothetical protein